MCPNVGLFMSSVHWASMESLWKVYGKLCAFSTVCIANFAQSVHSARETVCRKGKAVFEVRATVCSVQCVCLGRKSFARAPIMFACHRAAAMQMSAHFHRQTRRALGHRAPFLPASADPKGPQLSTLSSQLSARLVANC